MQNEARLGEHGSPNEDRRRMRQTVVADGEELHTQIVTTVAEVTRTDPLQLPPLFDAVDPDALESLFAPTTTGTRLGTIEFPYAGRTVTVEFDDGATITVS